MLQIKKIVLTNGMEISAGQLLALIALNPEMKQDRYKDFVESIIHRLPMTRNDITQASRKYNSIEVSSFLKRMMDDKLITMERDGKKRTFSLQVSS